MKRSLTLKSETLTELTDVDLLAVVGGAPPTHDCQTAPLTCIPTLAVKRILEIVSTLEP